MKSRINKLLVVVSIVLVGVFCLQRVYAAYTTDSLVASYNMDEGSGTSVADSTGNGNTGTTSGSPTWVTGGLSFDGTDDKISVPDSAYLDTPSFSYEMWFTMPSSAAWATASTFPRLFDKIGAGNTSGLNITLDRTTRNIQVFFASSTWASVTEGYASGSVLSSASGTTDYLKTYHVVFTFDNSTKAGILYVNGDVVSSGITTNSYVGNTTNLFIGSNTTNNTRNFKGTIHRVSIYSKALSASEILLNNAEGRGYNYDAEADAGGGISPALSTVTGTGTTTSVGTIQTSTVTVTVRDASGTALSDKVVSLLSSRGTVDSITTVLGTTGVDGVATFTVSSSQSGVSTLTAFADGIAITDTHEVTFTGDYVTETDVSYTSTLDSLALKMDLSYNSTLTSAPVVLVLHGYSGVITGNDVIQRLAQKGIFAIQTYKRGYGGSSGTSDDSAREIYDFIDAVEYVKSNYSQYVDESNINVVGYSGGGGNVYGLMTKFPDYFRSGNVFFGISDYGHDSTYGWYNNGANGGYQSLMQTRIGGTPDAVPDNYYARAHHLGAANNPYSNIQLFYDTSETTVPSTHATQYTTVSDLAGLTNITTRISTALSTTSELSDTFTADSLSSYALVTDASSTISYNVDGYIDWQNTNTSNFDVWYKKFTSLRNYNKTDRLVADFDFSVSSTTINSATTSAGSVLIGFRNSENFELRNSVALLISGGTAFLRVDYDGIALDSSNRTISTFTTVMATGTTYGMTLELGNSMATATLKSAVGTVLETKTVTFASNTFTGVDSFGIYNFNSETATPRFAQGTFDNLSVYSYSRWIHGYPQEGSGTQEGNITAENYFIPDMVAGTWSEPVLSATGTMFIPGYVKTEDFQVFLGTGRDEAGDLEYDISGDGLSTSTAKSFTVEGLTGDADITLTLYDLDPSSSYEVIDIDMTHVSTSTSIVSTNGDGTLVFDGTLGSIHNYLVYKIEDDSNPEPVPASVSVATQSQNVSILDQPLAPPTPEPTKPNSVCVSGWLYNVYTGEKCVSHIQKPNTLWVFSKDLQFRDVDPQVKLLQQYLNSKGFVVAGSGPGSLGNETNIFGSLTRNAVIRFQKANNITPAVGYFGPITRGFMK